MECCIEGLSKTTISNLQHFGMSVPRANQSVGAPVNVTLMAAPNSLALLHAYGMKRNGMRGSLKVPFQTVALRPCSSPAWHFPLPMASSGPSPNSSTLTRTSAQRSPLPGSPTCWICPFFLQNGRQLVEKQDVWCRNVRTKENSGKKPLLQNSPRIACVN